MKISNDKLNDKQQRDIQDMLAKSRGSVQYDKHLTSMKFVPQPEGVTDFLLLAIETDISIDMFAVRPTKLNTDLLPFDYDVTVTYLHTLLAVQEEGEDEPKVTQNICKQYTGETVDRFGNVYKIVELPCVRNLLEATGKLHILNHTMGIPFDSTLEHEKFIYTKTIHEDVMCDDKKDVINLFFGPLQALIQVNKQDNVTIQLLK